MEITGTFREISGLTVPVTVNWVAERCSTARVSENCSGWSTCKTLDSSACSTTGGGGASALGSPFESPQPASNKPMPRGKAAVGKRRCLMESPHALLLHSIDSPNLDKKRRGSGN